MDTNSKLLALVAFAAIVAGGPVAKATEVGTEQPLITENTRDLFNRLWDAGLFQIDEETGAVNVDANVLQKIKDVGLAIEQHAGNAPLCTGVCQ